MNPVHHFLWLALAAAATTAGCLRLAGLTKHKYGEVVWHFLAGVSAGAAAALLFLLFVLYL